MARERQKEILRRRNKKKRVKKLKAHLAVAKTAKERERLVGLISKRVAYYNPEK